jgi:hypothetical protein
VSVEWGIITSVVCPGGWHYPQLLADGQSVKITGFSFEQLLANMLEFRLRHLDLCGGAAMARIEAVRADLKNYLCSHFKQNCADAASAPVGRVGIGVTRDSYVTPINRASDWLARIAQGPLEHIDPALAAQRAQICATCPMNVSWQTGCTSCNDNVQVRTQMAKGSLATPYDRRLFVCRIFGHHNEVAVWLKDTHSESQQAPPSVCWKKDTYGV